MKLGFVITNLAGGGAEKVFIKLCSALGHKGHEVHLIMLEHLVEHPVPVNIGVHALTRPGKRIMKGVLGKSVTALRLRRLVRRLGRDCPFDMVVSTLPFADEVATRAGLPRHWCRIANTLSMEIGLLRSQNLAKAERRLHRYRRLYGSRPLIAVSDGVAQDLRGALGLTRAHIERIYNPFDFAAIRAAATEPAPLPAGPYVIHVGRFATQKRHDLLLDAWAKLKLPHRLVLLSPRDERLLAMIETRGLAQRVMVAGFQPNPYPWMAGADLLVLCSDHEGLPNVIIEALAVGTPVVSTDCPSGPREILGKAFLECLVPVGDVVALSQAIRRALANPPDPARVNLTPYESATVVSAYERLAARPAFPLSDRSST